MGKDDRFSVGFDFEIGDVKQSPCRDCFYRNRFPRCMTDCAALDHFQRALARTVSCSRQNGIEGYTVCRPDYYRPDA